MPSADPLPSWNDGATKAAIISFVADAATEGGDGYIAPADRIAVFDMDGTLMPEKPLPGAVLPLIDDVKAAVAKRPALADTPGVAALLKGDVPALVARAREGDPRSVARLISLVEDASPALREVQMENKPKINRYNLFLLCP